MLLLTQLAFIAVSMYIINTIQKDLPPKLYLLFTILTSEVFAFGVGMVYSWGRANFLQNVVGYTFYMLPGISVLSVIVVVVYYKTKGMSAYEKR